MFNEKFSMHSLKTALFLMPFKFNAQNTIIYSFFFLPVSIKKTLYAALTATFKTSNVP